MKDEYFPSWRYHKEKEPKLVHSREESEAMVKDGWVDTPALFEISDVVAAELKAQETEEPKAEPAPKKSPKSKAKEEQKED